MKRKKIARLWDRWQSAAMSLLHPAFMALTLGKAPATALTPLQRRLLVMGLAPANPSSLGRRHR